MGTGVLIATGNSVNRELSIIPWRGGRHAPKRKIDPPALRQQRRRARHDAVDAVKGQTRLTAEHDGIAGGELYDIGRIAALRPADSKETGIAERKRDHGRRKIALVTILMQPHLRRGMIIVDETTLGGMRIARERFPGIDQKVRHRGPWFAGLWVQRLVPVAGFIGD